MAQTGSISLLLRSLVAGEEQALVALHGRCWPWLSQLARRRLGSGHWQSIDEEDVAQEAFWGFVQSVRKRRVPQLNNRHDLFALLTHIVACKAASQIERECSGKRGNGKVWNEASLSHASDDSSSRQLDGHPDPQLAPSEAVMLQELFDRYFGSLPEGLKAAAELHAAGYSNKEIAEQLDCVERTVERKLAVARRCWHERAAGELGIQD